MQLPKYHETFIPILKVLSDEKIIYVYELLKRVRDEFYADIPQELLAQKTKSGSSLIISRIGWGKVYLKQAKLIKQPERGLVHITDKGKEILKKGTLTLKDILKDKDFLEYRELKAKESDEQVTERDDTPVDLVDAGITALELQVQKDLLDKLKTIDPYYFEKVVLRLLDKMGYGDYVETAKSGDGGIDGIINQDQLGLEKIYVQAKRYSENKVREKDIRNFIGGDERGY